MVKISGLEPLQYPRYESAKPAPNFQLAYPVIGHLFAF
nr:MAG TPA: hypothetical protein [Caudoviricetes sp.]